MNIRNNIILIVPFLLMACSSDLEDTTLEPEESSVFHATMRLEGSIDGFDNQTRATTSDWEDGAQLYIQYHTENGLVSGKATYNYSTDEWAVDYYGAIVRDQTTKCEVYYFENAEATSLTNVTLSQYSCVFVDKEATYLYQGGSVFIKAHLKPLTGRVRFRGTPDSLFAFTGLKWYSEYDIKNDTLIQQSGELNLTIGADGTLPYIYAQFADTTERELVVSSNDGRYRIHKQFDGIVLAVGKSGFVNVPTVESHKGWQIVENDPLGLCPDANHPHKIDMGTKVKWACCNVGAKTPIEYGNYFAWGETTPKSNYTIEYYKWWDETNKYIKYCNNSSNGRPDYIYQLELEDDAAHANWGGTWRMPTSSDFYELESYKKMLWTWVIINNIQGFKVTAQNGNCIFLPFSGHFEGTECVGSTYYLSRSLGGNETKLATNLEIKKNVHQIMYHMRYIGSSVRPVTE